MQLLRGGTIIAVSAVAFQMIAHLTNEFAFDDRVASLDADVEGGVFTWASSAAAFAVALTAVVYAVLPTRRRTAFLVLAVTAGFFSVDDSVQIHERIALRVGENILGLPDYAAVRLWLAFYLPLLVLSAALLWVLGRDVWPPAGRAIRVGLGILVASVPVEIAGLVTRPLDERGVEAPDTLRVAAEEGLELGGWLVAAAGMTAALTVALMTLGDD